MGIEPLGLALLASHLGQKNRKMAPVKGKIDHLATGKGFGEASEAHWVGQVIENDHHLSHKVVNNGPGDSEWTSPGPPNPVMWSRWGGGEVPGLAGHDKLGPGMTGEGTGITGDGEK